MAAATSSLSTLLKRTTIEDHEEVIKACNATLKQSKGSLEAQHAKVIALLKLDDRYDDALRVFEECGEKLKSAAPFEYAYALYKSGELDQALSLARQIDSDRGARHLEAQAVCISIISASGLGLIWLGSPTDRRILLMQPSSTRTSLMAVNLLFKTRRVTCASMEAQPTHNWNGRDKGTWCK